MRVMSRPNDTWAYAMVVLGRLTRVGRTHAQTDSHGPPATATMDFRMYVQMYVGTTMYVLHDNPGTV